MDMDMEHDGQPKPAFGAWLVQQKTRGGLVGQLATVAAGDRRFPKDADPEGVRTYLRSVMADGDMFEAVEDVEGDWTSL